MGSTVMGGKPKKEKSSSQIYQTESLLDNLDNETTFQILANPSLVR